jgi:hypothetical protein
MWSRVGAATIVALALACTPSAERSEQAPAQQGSATPTIRLLVPAADSTGGLPARFEWTAVDGADRYAIGVWNEVDRLMWSQDDIRATAIDRPGDLDLDAGTYMWRVSAIRNDRQVADSGWSAFVVRR